MGVCYLLAGKGSRVKRLRSPRRAQSLLRRMLELIGAIRVWIAPLEGAVGVVAEAGGANAARTPQQVESIRRISAQFAEIEARRD